MNPWETAMTTNHDTLITQSQQELQTSRESIIQHPRATPLEIATWISPVGLSGETHARIRELLRHAELSLDALDRNILLSSHTSVQDITHLIQQREEHISHMKVMRGALSIINRIPPEVLGRIFVLFIGDKVLIPPKPTNNPWKLGHVSSYWRRILWDTPEAWKTIQVGTKDVATTCTMERLIGIRAAIEDVFSRSNTTHSVVVNNHFSIPIANVIVTLSKHITSLSLGNLSFGIFFSLVELSQGSWNSLQTLRFQLYDDGFHCPSVKQSSFQVAPSLRDVGITFMIRSPNGERLLPSILLLPWSQLTHLAIIQVSMPWGTAQQVLSQCNELVCCCLNITHDRKAIVTSSTITLLALESLQISQDRMLNWTIILKPFTCPNLKHLSILSGTRIHLDHDRIAAYPMISPDGITQMVLRSGCSLETLCIGGDLRANGKNLPIVTMDVETLLQLSPVLRILIGSFIFPSASRSTWSGLLDLSQLECLVIRLQTRGFRQFLNFIDSHITYHPEKRAHIYTGSVKRAEIWCNKSPGTMALYQRYKNRSWLYRQVGIYIDIEFENHAGEKSDGDDSGDGDDHNDGDSDNEEGEGGLDNDSQPTKRTGWLSRYVGDLLSSVV